MRPKSEKELYLIAEQVIIGNRALRDIELEDDDRHKVVALVERGAESLSERARRYQVAQRQLKGKLARSAPDSSVLMPDSPRISLVDLSEYLALDPITLSRILEGSEQLHRNVTQIVTRILDPEDFVAWIQQLSTDDLEKLKRQLSESHQMHWDELRERPAEVDGTKSVKKVSVALVTHINPASGAGEKLLDYLDEYRSYLHGKVLEYGRMMAQGIGLIDRLAKFDTRQWQVLIGLTPREDLARFAKVLPEEVVSKVRSSLPERQREELDETMAIQERLQSERLEALIDMLEALKSWLGVVSKVEKN